MDWKRKLSGVLALALSLALLTACGKADASSGKTEDTPPAPPDLTGEWKQTNSGSDDSWQAATITGDTIEVYWVSDGGDTKSLYWAGTYIAPETADEPYTWASENDKSKTSNALLASGDDTKEFAYQDGVLSYDVSALGTTTTVKLEPVK